MLQLVDQIILNDRLDESMVLLHLQFPHILPLRMLTAGRYKSRVHVGLLIDNNKSLINRPASQGASAAVTCTDQWLQLEGVQQLGAKFAKCKVACAGSAGYQLRSDDEKRATIELNRQDVELWQYANALWEQRKKIVLNATNVSPAAFQAIVERYNAMSQHA